MKYSFIFFIALLLSACNNNPTKPIQQQQQTPIIAPQTTPVVVPIVVVDVDKPAQNMSCKLSYSTGSFAPHFTHTLSVTCTPAATSYEWSKNTVCGTSGNTTCPVSPVGDTQYSVIGYNEATKSAPATVVVPVKELQTTPVITTEPVITPTPLPPITQQPSSDCVIKDITWSWGGLDLKTIPQGTIVSGQGIAYRTAIPTYFTKHSGGISYNTVPLQLSVSQKPCEWLDEQKAKGCGAVGSLPQLMLSNSAEQGVCNVTSGSIYYFNVKSAYPWNGQETCANGQQCSFYLSW